jgi:uncharacterized protein YbjT (DUF2867 family)
MKIVIIGGSGLIGSKFVAMLGERGHDAVPAAPQTGVNTITGEGLAKVVTGADVVIDVSNSPSFEAEAAMKFFKTSTTNILEAELGAGVRHHVALSVVGIEGMADVGYFRAKLAQEELIRSSESPYSIVHATQFFEFIKGIADDATAGGKVRLAPVLFQPIAAEDVARTLCTVAMGTPVHGIVEVAGPQRYRLDELVRLDLRARSDPREVVTDPQARYFGAVLGERSLVPADDARTGHVTYEAWQQQQLVTRSPATVQHVTTR